MTSIRVAVATKADTARAECKTKKEFKIKQKYEVE